MLASQAHAHQGHAYLPLSCLNLLWQRMDVCISTHVTGEKQTSLWVLRGKGWGWETGLCK